MECKLLNKEDIELMAKFIDYENTNYEKEKLMEFLNEKNAYVIMILAVIIYCLIITID